MRVWSQCARRQEPLDVWQGLVTFSDRFAVIESRQGDKGNVGYLRGTPLGKRIYPLILFSDVELECGLILVYPSFFRHNVL